MGPPRMVFVIGTLDTKGEELAFLAESIQSSLPLCAKGLPAPQAAPLHVSLIDVSIKPLISSTSAEDAASSPPAQLSTRFPIISINEILAFQEVPSSGLPEEQMQSTAKSMAIAQVAQALRRFLKAKHTEGVLGGAVGAGGSCGSAIIAPALQGLPLGVPKVLLSTMVSSDAAALVGSSDVLLVPSVADISGLNSITRTVLRSAAAATAGLSVAYAADCASGATPKSAARPTIGLSMFGVTTPCVTEVQRLLKERGLESVAFHATGAGGRAMEDLLASGALQGVIDITTTEVADFIVGGVLACDETRFDAVVSRKLPMVLSVGALDMVNFREPASVPPRFADRLLFHHNPQVTLMRTTAAEMQQIGDFIARKALQCEAPVRVLFPQKGLSGIDNAGLPFFDEEADLALLQSLEQRLSGHIDKKVAVVPCHINDPEFAKALVDTYCALAPPPELLTAPFPIPGLTTSLHTPRAQTIQNRIKGQLSALGKGPILIEEMAEKRADILDRLRAQIAAGRPVIGAGAGTGISAKGEEAGGVDLIVIYNSGRFRMAGRGSLAGLLPFKDANAVVMEMASEVLPVVKSAPVLAGVCATDPFRIIPRFLREVAAVGFAGVQNFPTVGLFDGVFRQNIEGTGMGFALEVDMIAMASAMGFLTTPYAFNEDEARDMAAAGADVVVAHMGLTTAGTIGAHTALTVDQSVARIQAIADAAREEKADVIVLCHGGPLSGPSEASYVLQRTKNVHGFYGASSMERLPVEVALLENLRAYKDIRLP